MLTKAFLNAYDTAIVVSGDSDYVPVLNILNTIGKVTVVVGVCDQYLGKVRRASDDMLILDDTFFSACLRPPRYETAEDASDLDVGAAEETARAEIGDQEVVGTAAE